MQSLSWYTRTKIDSFVTFEQASTTKIIASVLIFFQIFSLLTMVHLHWLSLHYPCIHVKFRNVNMVICFCIQPFTGFVSTHIFTECKYFGKGKIARRKSCRLLCYVIDCLQKTLSSDTEGFLNKERFDVIMQPLVDQVLLILIGWISCFHFVVIFYTFVCLLVKCAFI